MTTNSEWMERRQASVARGVGVATSVVVERALNSELWDVEGRRYIDFAAGIAVLNTGHCHPRVVSAVEAQLRRFTHACFQVASYEPYFEVAERLNTLAPISGPARTLLLTTGAEAVENAVKIARVATRRNGVIAFAGGFHGRTALAGTLTGKVAPYRQGVSVPDVWHVPFPMEGGPVTVEQSMNYLNMVLRADTDPGRVAAIIIEPVQGEGGFYQAPPELMRGLRDLCDRIGAVLIADEVQTGFGRTGTLFSMEQYEVEADLICVAKGLAGGLPLSGVIGKESIIQQVEPGGLGGTFAGNPLSCAAAIAVLDVIDQEHLLDQAKAIGIRLRDQLARIAQRNDVVPMSAPRGPGAMVAFDITTPTGEPDPETTRRVIQLACEGGLILLSCGTFGNTIRILAPLTVSMPIIGEGLAILTTALQQARAEIYTGRTA